MSLQPNINLHDDIAWGPDGWASEVPVTEGGASNPLNDDPADKFEPSPLVPNKSDIAKHLYALFAPAFVHPHPDAL
jgi:hypothetical protein